MKRNGRFPIAMFGTLLGLCTGSLLVSPIAADELFQGELLEGGLLQSDADQSTNAQDDVAQDKDIPTAVPHAPLSWTSPAASVQEACADAKTRFKHWMQRTHWGYPEHFGREPLGSTTAVAMAAMKQAGHEERSILYRYDFYPEENPNAHLMTPFGVAHLGRILQRGFPGPLTLGIERSVANPALDEARRQAVAEHPILQELLGSPDQIRLITKPWGLDGVEAIQHYRGQLTSGASALSPSGSMSGGGGSMGSAAGMSSR